MKANFKIILSFIFITVLIFSGLKIVQAQKETNDYLNQYISYQEIYKEFTTAKEQYLKYKTLTAKDELVVAIKKFILKRNEVLQSYFLALKTKLRNTPGVVSSERQAALVSQLDAEIIWLNNENRQLLAMVNPSLADLFVVSDHTENKSVDFHLLAYSSLGAIILGKSRNLQGESVSIATLLTDRVQHQESSQSGQLNDWLKEIDNKNYLSQREIEAGEQKQDTFKTNKKLDRLVKVYEDIKANLEVSKNYLLDAYSFQKEINNLSQPND